MNNKNDLHNDEDEFIKDSENYSVNQDIVNKSEKIDTFIKKCVNLLSDENRIKFLKNRKFFYSTIKMKLRIEKEIDDINSVLLSRRKESEKLYLHIIIGLGVILISNYFFNLELILTIYFLTIIIIYSLLQKIEIETNINSLLIKNTINENQFNLLERDFEQINRKSYLRDSTLDFSTISKLRKKIDKEFNQIHKNRLLIINNIIYQKIQIGLLYDYSELLEILGSHEHTEAVNDTDFSKLIYH